MVGHTLWFLGGGVVLLARFGFPCVLMAFFYFLKLTNSAAVEPYFANAPYSRPSVLDTVGTCGLEFTFALRGVGMCLLVTYTSSFFLFFVGFPGFPVSTCAFPSPLAGRPALHPKVRN